MNNITIKKITNLDEAKKIWEELSYRESIYDSWDFRNLYYSLLNYPLAFYTAYNQGECIGLLPLQINIDKGIAEFFGGGYFEENKIYIKEGYENVLEILINSVTEKAELSWMDHSMSILKNSEIIEYEYIKNLTGINSYEDYIEKNFNGKSKNTIKRQIKKLFLNDVRVEYNQNPLEDFEFFVSNNIRRFGDESTFHYLHRKDFLKSLLTNYECYTISIFINGEKKCVGMSLFYKSEYIFINSGNDGTVPNISKYLYFLLIDQAVKLGARKFDARSNNCGWKESFNLDKVPLYILKLNNE